LLADEDPEWTAKVINLDEARCSRLDLFIDWQGGWHPTFENGDERAFIKRVHADVERYSVNGKVDGYEIGKSSVRGRIYNKTVQCKKKHVEWYPTLLQERNGGRYDPEQDVWRLEFQLRREGVKGFRLYAKPEMADPDEVIDAEIEAEDLPHLHSVRKALHWAGPLWGYLTKRWLRLTMPNGDPNRGRWPEHPTWAALREGFASVALREAELPEHGLELARAARYTGNRRLLDRMAVGVTTTLEAMDTDPGAALVSYVAYLTRIAGRIKRQQYKRAAAWRRREGEAAGRGFPPPLTLMYGAAWGHVWTRLPVPRSGCNCSTWRLASSRVRGWRICAYNAKRTWPTWAISSSTASTIWKTSPPRRAASANCSTRSGARSIRLTPRVGSSLQPSCTQHRATRATPPTARPPWWIGIEFVNGVVRQTSLRVNAAPAPSMAVCLLRRECVQGGLHGDVHEDLDRLLVVGACRDMARVVVQ
jgi:hypothetical protein